MYLYNDGNYMYIVLHTTTKHSTPYLHTCHVLQCRLCLILLVAFLFSCFCANINLFISGIHPSVCFSNIFVATSSVSQFLFDFTSNAQKECIYNFKYIRHQTRSNKIHMYEPSIHELLNYTTRNLKRSLDMNTNSISDKCPDGMWYFACF
jgi:hypothetical protein